MSKVVKSIGRGISKVVKGVTKAVSGHIKRVTKAVKKFASSKFGKAILMAGTIYFGGAALMGAWGGASAGTGVAGTLSGALKGAGAGIGNAWSGLTAATGSAMGGNFAQAGSQLSGGMTGAYSAGKGAVTTSGLLNTGSGIGNPFGEFNLPEGANSLAGSETLAGSKALGGVGNAAGKEAALAKAVTRGAMINAGSQLVGNVMTGKAEEAKYKEDLKQEEAARSRHNSNVGSRLFSDEQQMAFNPNQGVFNPQRPTGLLFSGGTGVGQRHY